MAASFPPSTWRSTRTLPLYLLLIITRAIYNHCQKRQPATEREGTHPLFASLIEVSVQVDFTGAHLYEKLVAYLSGYLSELFSVKFITAC